MKFSAMVLKPSQFESTLRLRVADTFWLRLRGLCGAKPLADNEGLLIVPCRAIHTYFLRQPIDVVFLYTGGQVCSCRQSVAPKRIAWERRAAMVVELAAGYCQRHPDYAEKIHAALQLRVSTPLSK